MAEESKATNSESDVTAPLKNPAAGAALRLAAVVVTYNRLDQLKITVARLLDSAADVLDTLVVVDNASTDDTARWLSEQVDPRLRVLRCKTNEGGAGGFEAGLRLIRDEIDPDWVVVMDDDARPKPGALEAFVAAERPDDLAAAAAVYFPNGQICEMNRPSVNPFWRPAAFGRTLWRALRGKGRDGYHIPRKAYASEAPTEIDLTSFVGLFLSRRMLAEAGLPDRRLFLYGDDVIYTLGLRRVGFRIHFEPTLVFEHDCSTFANDQKRVFDPLWKVYYSYRNGLVMYRRAAGLLFWPLMVLAASKWFLIGRRYGADRPVYNKLYRRAVRDAVRQDFSLSHAEVQGLVNPEP